MNVIASHMSSMQDPPAKLANIPNRKQGNLACPPVQTGPVRCGLAGWAFREHCSPYRRTHHPSHEVARRNRRMLRSKPKARSRGAKAHRVSPNLSETIPQTTRNKKQRRGRKSTLATPRAWTSVHASASPTRASDLDSCILPSVHLDPTYTQRHRQHVLGPKAAPCFRDATTIAVAQTRR